MRAAIIRWIALARREMQNYEPLLATGTWQFVGVGSRRPDHDLSAINFPVVQPISLDYMLLKVPGLRQTLSKLTGLQIENLNYMFGLEQHLKTVDVVDLAETYHSFGYQVARAKRSLGYRLVVSVHENIPFTHENLWMRRKTKQAIFQAADHFFALSELAKQSLVLEGIPARRITIMHTMGVDTSRFIPAEKDTAWLERLNLSADDQVILFIGRLVWSKGIFDLLYAFKLLSSDPELRKIPLKLLIVGNGEEHERMQQLIDRLGLREQTRVLPHAPYAEMPNIHNLADVFVLPSIATPRWQEQFGAVLAESMACAKPVVGASSGAIPEVIGPAGLVAQANDFTSLASRVKELLLNQRQRTKLAALARQRAVDTYDSRCIAAKIQQVYEQILQ